MDTNTVGLVAPFASSANLQLAQQAVTILQANGQAVGALPIVNGAAGYANAAGITAMSLLSQVAATDQDSVVQPTRPTTGGPAWPPGGTLRCKTSADRMDGILGRRRGKLS